MKYNLSHLDGREEREKNFMDFKKTIQFPFLIFFSMRLNKGNKLSEGKVDFLK